MNENYIKDMNTLVQLSHGLGSYCMGLVVGAAAVYRQNQSLMLWVAIFFVVISVLWDDIALSDRINWGREVEVRQNTLLSGKKSVSHVAMAHRFFASSFCWYWAQQGLPDVFKHRSSHFCCMISISDPPLQWPLPAHRKIPIFSFNASGLTLSSALPHCPSPDVGWTPPPTLWLTAQIQLMIPINWNWFNVRVALSAFPL